MSATHRPSAATMTASWAAGGHGHDPGRRSPVQGTAAEQAEDNTLRSAIHPGDAPRSGRRERSGSRKTFAKLTRAAPFFMRPRSRIPGASQVPAAAWWFLRPGGAIVEMARASVPWASGSSRISQGRSVRCSERGPGYPKGARDRHQGTRRQGRLRHFVVDRRTEAFYGDDADHCATLRLVAHRRGEETT